MFFNTMYNGIVQVDFQYITILGCFDRISNDYVCRYNRDGHYRIIPSNI